MLELTQVLELERLQKRAAQPTRKLMMQLEPQERLV